MIVNYTDGLFPSLAISVGLSLVLFIIFLIKDPIDNPNHLEFIRNIWIVAGFFVAMSSILFNVMFSVLNFIYHQPYIKILQAEFESGVFSLRLTSFGIGIQAIYYGIRGIRRHDFLYQNQNTIRFGLESMSAKLPPENLSIIFLWQSFIYTFALSVLWSFVIVGVRTPFTLILNWAIFFIVDDWAIIWDYFVLLKGRMLLTHRLRIDLINFLVVGLMLYTTFTEFHWTISVLIAFVASNLIFFRYIPVLKPSL